jgi:integrase
MAIVPYPPGCTMERMPSSRYVICLVLLSGLSWSRCRGAPQRRSAWYCDHGWPRDTVRPRQRTGHARPGAYRVKRDGTARPKSSLAKERTCLNVYILPALGNAWIGDLDLPELNATIRHLTLQDGNSASGSTKGTVASVLRWLFAWAREERIIPINRALELRTGWGGSVRRRVIIPSIPQVLRLAKALDLFKPGLGDMAMVLAFTGLRWEEAVAVPIDNVSLDGQCMKVDRTASESGGRRDVGEDLKTRAAERTVMIPDIAMPAVRRLADRGAQGRERSDGRLYSRLINGERGGYLGYAMWRRYLKLPRATPLPTPMGSSATPRTSCGTSAPRC